MPVFAVLGAILGTTAGVTATAAVVGGAAAAAGTAYSVVKTEDAISKAKRQQNEAKARNATAEGKVKSDAYALKFGVAPQEGSDLNALCRVFNGRLECFSTAAEAADFESTGRVSDRNGTKVFTPAPAGKPRAADGPATTKTTMATINEVATTAENARANAKNAATKAEQALAAINNVGNLVKSVIGQNVAQAQQTQATQQASVSNYTPLIIAGVALLAIVLFLRK